jgi:hypothetical protein
MFFPLGNLITSGNWHDEYESKLSLKDSGASL